VYPFCEALSITMASRCPNWIALGIVLLLCGVLAFIAAETAAIFYYIRTRSVFFFFFWALWRHCAACDHAKILKQK
jgi:hypothetical protein